jgi:hypothetical protein
MSGWRDRLNAEAPMGLESRFNTEMTLEYWKPRTDEGMLKCRRISDPGSPRFCLGSWR